MIATKVFINSAPELLTKISIPGADFIPLSRAPEEANPQSAVIVIFDQDLCDNLVMAASLPAPVLVLAGTADDYGKEAYSIAVACGISDEGIIYKDGSELCNHAGYRFTFPVSNGVGPAAIMKLAHFAVDKGLLPENIVLWNPDEIIHNRQAEVQLEKSQCESGDTGVQMPDSWELSEPWDLSDLMRMAANTVLAIRTVPEVDRQAAGRLAIQIQALHLEIAQTPGAFQIHHPQAPEQAVRSGRYAYSDGSKVMVNRSKNRPFKLVVEIEPGDVPPELLDDLHEKADFVLHISGSFQESLQLIEDWSKAGGRLDAIIPGLSFEKELYMNNFPGIVMDVPELARMLNRKLA